VNCFNHPAAAAVGICSVCQKALCPACVGRDAPRLLCRDCEVRGGILFGFEYRSAIGIGGWPLLHVCSGIDSVTLRPKVAKGVIAIGNVAIGALAIGGVACGLFAVGGLSIGLLMALGGCAIGAGFSMGGVAIGSIAIGAVAIGFHVAVGAVALGPHVVNTGRCDPAALDYLRGWFGSAVPRSCR
jgi:hypothetical protein